MTNTKISFVPVDDLAVPPATEAVRQVFSAIALVRDRLNEVSVEHDYSAGQRHLFDMADELLGVAHRLLRRTVT